MTKPEMSPRFFVKSFFADTVQEAMEQARHVMGPDALLLNTKPAPPEARQLGEFEVVFGEYSDATGEPETQREEPPAPEPLAEVRRSVEDIRDLLLRGTAEEEPCTSPRRQLMRVTEELMEAGVEAALAREIAEAVRGRMNKRMVPDIARPHAAAEWDEAGVTYETHEEVACRCRVNAELGAVTALVGPPGAGKTTTVAKLAVSQGLAVGRPVRLISVDTQRVGGAAQLEIYASILGVPFQAVDSPSALAHAIDYAPANTLLLIDTPGYSASLFEELGCDLAKLFARRQEIDTHLVLTASMQPKAMRRAADLYSAFRPSKLLFTHLDEETSYAAMFCETARRGMPISYFATGQSVPEDLEAAAAKRITDSLVRQLPKAMQAVA